MVRVCQEVGLRGTRGGGKKERYSNAVRDPYWALGAKGETTGNKPAIYRIYLRSKGEVGKEKKEKFFTSVRTCPPSIHRGLLR